MTRHQQDRDRTLRRPLIARSWPLSGRLAGLEPVSRSMPPVIVTNAMNHRIRQVEEQIESERREELMKLQERERSSKA